MVAPDDDVLQLGPPKPGNRRPTHAIVIAIVIIAVVAVGIGWRLTRGSSASSSPPSPTRRVPAITLADVGDRCSAQHGRRLWLGIELVNGSDTTATITSVRIEVPLGGLQALAIHQAPCVVAARPVRSFTVPDGERTWLSASFDVLVSCPRLIPVWFVVEYNLQGRSQTLSPSPFLDLWRVEYTGCDTASPNVR